MVAQVDDFKTTKLHEDKSITSVTAFGFSDCLPSGDFSNYRALSGLGAVLAATSETMNQPKELDSGAAPEEIFKLPMASAGEDNQNSLLKSHRVSESGVPSFAGTDASNSDLSTSPLAQYDVSSNSESSNGRRGGQLLSSSTKPACAMMSFPTFTGDAASRGAYVQLLKPNNHQGSPAIYRLQGHAPNQQTLPQSAVSTATHDTNSGVNNSSFDSNLSLRDMYHDVLNGQKEYFQDDDNSSDDEKFGAKDRGSSRSSSIHTPPSTLHGSLSTPGKSPPLHALPGPACAMSTAMGVASFWGSTNSTAFSATTVGSILSGTSQQQQQQPMLYSAIGSLEDPASSSYKGWRQRGEGVGRTKPTKFEFPSSSGAVPAPEKKKKNALLEKKRAATMSQGVLATQVGEQQQTLPPPPPPPGTTHESKRKPPAPTKHDASSVAPPPPAANTVSISNKAKPVSALRRGTLSTATDAGGTAQPGPPTARGKASAIAANKKVTIAGENLKRRKARKPKKAAELFRPSSDAYTPRMGKKEIKYKPAEMRTPVQQMASPLGTLSRPNFRDALRRVAMIIHQHIVKIERRFESSPQVHRSDDDGLFSRVMKEAFSEERYVTPRYKCTMVRVPMARPGMMVGMKLVREKYEIPTEAEIYEFAERLFKTVQLSSECSIVCLIYVERLMEASRVPLLSTTWRPIFMCGLLLASKVWQDLSSWNIEFASVYPQYSLESINKLEIQFLKFIKWDLYISSSAYAKYYFALRSLVEKTDFRQRYNRMVGRVGTVEASEARKIEERTTVVKEEVLLQLSRSMY